MGDSRSSALAEFPQLQTSRHYRDTNATLLDTGAVDRLGDCYQPSTSYTPSDNWLGPDIHEKAYGYVQMDTGDVVVLPRWMHTSANRRRAPDRRAANPGSAILPGWEMGARESSNGDANREPSAFARSARRRPGDLKASSIERGGYKGLRWCWSGDSSGSQHDQNWTGQGERPEGKQQRL